MRAGKGNFRYMYGESDIFDLWMLVARGDYRRLQSTVQSSGTDMEQTLLVIHTEDDENRRLPPSQLRAARVC